MKIIKYILILLIVLFPTNTYTKDDGNVVYKLKDIIKIITEVSKKEKLDVVTSLAFAKTESDFKPWAYNKGDPSHGLFQMNFDTAKAYNKNIKEVKDLYIVRENTVAAIRFIKDLKRKYPKATPIDLYEIYNLGETRYNKGKRSPEKHILNFKRHYNKFKKESHK